MRLRIIQFLVFLCIAAAAGLLQYLFFVPYKTRTVSPEEYRGTAYHLRDHGSWKFGFVQGHHGATLVRTAIDHKSPTTHKPSYDREVLRSPDLPSLMAQELDAIPRKAAIELAYYVLVIAISVFALPWLLTRLVRATPRRAQILVGGSVSAIVGTGAFLAPFTVLGYGRSAFSTWSGPYPLSYSGAHFWFPRVPGETVSYRMVLEMVFYLPGRALDLVPRSIHIPEVQFALFLFLFGLLFYGIVFSCVTIIVREVFRVYCVPFGAAVPESTQVSAVTRQVILAASAILVADGALVVLGTKSDWHGLALWFYGCCFFLALLVSTCSIVQARSILHQKSRVKARRARPLLICLIGTAAISVLLLDGEIRNSYLGDWAHIVLLAGLLAGLALCFLQSRTPTTPNGA